VYARLGEQGAIESAHGRGTFVTPGRSGPAGLGALAARVAHEARSHDIDPRELATVLYGRYDEPLPPSPAPGDREAEQRRGLRAEIEVLEQQLATLEPLSTADEGAGTRASVTGGARLISALELSRTRDKLADRVAARRREMREARTPQPPQARPRSDGGWPELRLSGLTPRPAPAISR
jgi:hypothetical protein